MSNSQFQELNGALLESTGEMSHSSAMLEPAESHPLAPADLGGQGLLFLLSIDASCTQKECVVPFSRLEATKTPVFRLFQTNLMLSRDEF